MRVWHRLIDRGTASTDKPGQGPESGMGPYRSRSRLRVMLPFVVNGTKIMGEKTQTGLLMPQPKEEEEEEQQHQHQHQHLYKLATKFPIFFFLSCAVLQFSLGLICKKRKAKAVPSAKRVEGEERRGT